MFKRFVFAVFSLVKLREDQIPNLQKSVAVATGCASFFAAAALFAQIDINFAVGTARTRTDLPEVIVKFNYVFGIKSWLLQPNFLCLVVVGINRDPKFFSRQFANFR